jgi:ribosomal protein S18 acetylase RimI-like enzyme
MSTGPLGRAKTALGPRLFSVHVLDIVRRDVDKAAPEPRADEGLAVHRVEGGDLVIAASRVGSSPVVLRLSGLPFVDSLAAARRLRRFRRRLARGEVAYVATQGNAVAGWIWLSQARVFRDRWIGLRLQFAPDESYVYDLWVYPKFRSSGAGALIMAEMLRDLQRAGSARWVYGFIDRDNKPNQVLQRLVFGFRSVQSVEQVEFMVAFGRVLTWTLAPPDGPCACRGLGRVLLHARS